MTEEVDRKGECVCMCDYGVCMCVCTHVELQNSM